MLVHPLLGCLIRFVIADLVLIFYYPTGHIFFGRVSFDLRQLYRLPALMFNVAR